ncbi:tyrosine-type recombinase/integrase [Streptomyces iconiensis]|uniref:Site-specific integrase n=1 Tax=Streptomyces iconiensis TaxID=1384038 RepID=A0ABT7A6C0_9ACTN|nr:site-specific integrase [Streptomyces iconiensis]MDJ1136851.1 site-specific integrase [Streptomyces iconiensis]
MPLLFQRHVGVENRPIPPSGIRQLLNEVLSRTGLTDAVGQPLTFSLHDFRRLFITDAIMNGMRPHIAQLVVGHRDINTTMGYKAVYPGEVINGHRAFIARRRATRPSEEYRTPTDEEWKEFGHFERRRVALGDCGCAHGTSCVHEHSCLRCSLLRPDPDKRQRIVTIRDNLLNRIAEAEKEGWLGAVEGLKVSLAGAVQKLAQLDERSHRGTTVNLGMPAFREIAGQTVTAPKNPSWRSPRNSCTSAWGRGNPLPVLSVTMGCSVVVSPMSTRRDRGQKLFLAEAISECRLCWSQETRRWGGMRRAGCPRGLSGTAWKSRIVRDHV